MAAPYENLFQGAAFVGGMCTRLGLPWAGVAPFVGAFSDALEAYFELSLGTTDGALGVMTRGEGKPFVHRYCKLMEQRGVPEAELKRFLGRAAYFEQKNVYVKIDLGEDGPVAYSYCFRTRPPLDVVRGWMGERTELDSSLVDSVARALGKRRAAFLATSVASTGAFTEKVYFAASEGERGWTALGNAAQVAGAPPTSWHLIEASKRDLERGDRFLSLSFSEGRSFSDGAAPFAQVYFGQVDEPVLTGILTRAGTSPADVARVEMMASVLDRRRFDYVGFRLGGGLTKDLIAGKAYALSRGVSSPAEETVLERWLRAMDDG